MKFISLDIETTGVFNDGGKSPDKILQLSGVVEDWANPLPLEELPHFTIFVAHDRYVGEAYALALNAWILKELAEWEKTHWKEPEQQFKTKYPVLYEGNWEMQFIDFIKRHFGNSRVNMMGKNAAAFDLQFLPKHVQNKFRSRILDPGSVFADLGEEALPGLGEICQSHSLSAVTHDAYEDALKVIEVIRLSEQYKRWRARWVRDEKFRSEQVPPASSK